MSSCQCVQCRLLLLVPVHVSRRRQLHRLHPQPVELFFVSQLVDWRPYDILQHIALRYAVSWLTAEHIWYLIELYRFCRPVVVFPRVVVLTLPAVAQLVSLFTLFLLPTWLTHLFLAPQSTPQSTPSPLLVCSVGWTFRSSTGMGVVCGGGGGTVLSIAVFFRIYMVMTLVPFVRFLPWLSHDPHSCRDAALFSLLFLVSFSFSH